jgi:hypothetical protein
MIKKGFQLMDQNLAQITAILREILSVLRYQNDIDP